MKRSRKLIFNIFFWLIILILIGGLSSGETTQVKLIAGSVMVVMLIGYFILRRRSKSKKASGFTGTNVDNLADLLNSCSVPVVAYNLIHKMSFLNDSASIVHNAKDLKSYAINMDFKYKNDECINVLCDLAATICNKYDDVQRPLDIPQIFLLAFNENLVLDGYKSPYIFFENPTIQKFIMDYYSWY